MARKSSPASAGFSRLDSSRLDRSLDQRRSPPERLDPLQTVCVPVVLIGERPPLTFARPACIVEASEQQPSAAFNWSFHLDHFIE
jgi:hypothetical protein